MRRSPGFPSRWLSLAALAAAAPLQSPGPRRLARRPQRVTVEVREGRLYYSLARDGRALILPSLLGFEFRGAPPLRDGLRITDTTRQSHDDGGRSPGAKWRGCATTTTSCTSPSRRPRRRPAVHRHVPRLQRRRRLPLRAARPARPRRLRDHRRAHRVRPRRQRARLVDPVEPAAARPLGDALLVGAGEHARQRADAAHDGDAGRPHVHRDPRGEPRRLRADVPRGPAHGEPHAARRRWRRWPTASRCADARRSSRRGARSSSPTASTTWRRRCSASTSIRRTRSPSTDWIQPMKYVGIWWGMHINTMTWSSGPKHGATTANTQALHRLRRGERLRRRAGRGMEHRLGRRLDQESERVLVHASRIPTTISPASPPTRRQKGVRLIAHNETSGGIENYERQLDSAFASTGRSASTRSRRAT